MLKILGYKLINCYDFLRGCSRSYFPAFSQFFLLCSHFFPLDTLLKFFLIILYSIAHILLIDDEHFHTFFGIEQCNNSMCLTKHNSINLQYFQEGMTPLMYAAYKGSVEVVEFLLQNGADPNVDSTKDAVSHVYWNFL